MINETIKQNCTTLIRSFLENTERLIQPEKDAVKRTAISHITSSMRRSMGGGAHRIPTECPRCGVLQPSVRAAKYHPCRKKQAGNNR
jgi:hypothetical protein